MGSQQNILQGAQGFEGGGPEGAPRTEDWGGGLSKTTGKQGHWPDWELTSQATVAISCGEEEGMRLASELSAGCRGLEC